MLNSYLFIISLLVSENIHISYQWLETIKIKKKKTKKCNLKNFFLKKIKRYT